LFTLGCRVLPKTFPPCTAVFPSELASLTGRRNREREERETGGKEWERIGKDKRQKEMRGECEI